ncbi:MAG: peroxidase [Algicola sp.]|nr:peroxidase [Algicola sp.]
MNNQRHHGRHSFVGKNELCSMSSYDKEQIGRFGRMFRSLSPLYLKPKSLEALGSADGPMLSGDPANFTNDIPLGMIFFGQFIDHDITFDTTSNFFSINSPTEIENTRSANLDLDCVFGGGPEDEPFLYDNPNTRGLYLLTGKTNNNQGQGVALEKHDLPRTGTGTAIIGDPRNDENRVLSQLQLAMIRFYNAAYDKLKSDYAANSISKSSKDIYEEARELVTWHYQWVVINEFLPAMCGQKIVSDILGKGRQVYKPCDTGYIPVEFSVAAYRFGHSMIAENIKLQPTGTEGSIFSPAIGMGFSPIKNNNQIIDWKSFFDFDGTHQKAEQLDTKLAKALLDLKFINSTNPADRSLATRNLRRGQSFLLPSGESVAKCLDRPQSEIDDVKNLINNIAQTHDIDLSAGTPLWFYILAEAEEIGKLNDSGGSTPGEGLGPVGAIIVAEVIIGLLELDPHSFLGSNRDWTPSFGNGNEFTMKDLLEMANTAIEL